MTNTSMADSSKLIRWLTYIMFMMFAMTSDSVGEIIKEVKIAFDVSNTQASLMHSLPMLGIALSGLFLGFLCTSRPWWKSRLLKCFYSWGCTEARCWLT